MQGTLIPFSDGRLSLICIFSSVALVVIWFSLEHSRHNLETDKTAISTVTDTIKNIINKTSVFETNVSLSEVEIFIVTNHVYSSMFQNVLKPSIDIFWPDYEKKITIVTEVDDVANENFINYASSLPNTKLSKLNGSEFDDSIYHKNGHIKQQLIMFYADEFANFDCEYSDGALIS